MMEEIEFENSTITTGQTRETCQYDGLNRRIIRNIYSSGSLFETRHFYYTKNWQDLEERVGSSTSADRQYVWGIRYLDEVVCCDYGGSRSYAMQDANFNVTSICDTSGNVLEYYGYDPYGNWLRYDNTWTPLGSVPTSTDWLMGFQGLMMEWATGLIYNRNRMIHPWMGRFMSRDIIGYRGGTLNLYEYEISAPIGLLDPQGNVTGCELSCGASLATALLTGGVDLPLILIAYAFCMNACEEAKRTNPNSCSNPQTSPPPPLPQEPPSGCPDNYYWDGQECTPIMNVYIPPIFYNGPPIIPLPYK